MLYNMLTYCDITLGTLLCTLSSKVVPPKGAYQRRKKYKNI